MLSEISFGQFVPGKAFLYKLDPRTKLVLTMFFITTILFCSNYQSTFLMVIATLFVVLKSGVPWKLYFKSTKAVIFIIAITSIMNLFYGSGTPLFEFGPIKLTYEGFSNSIFVAARIISLMLVSSVLTFTTSPNDLTDAIEKLMSPLKFFKCDVHAVAMMMTIALRFVPTLLEESDKIMSAQKSRGASFEQGKLVDRAKSIVTVLVPLFISSFKRAYDLAIAMECRCYRGGEGRTRMKVFRFSSYDVIGVLFTLAICMGVIICSVIFPKI